MAGCGSTTTSQFGFCGSLTVSMPIISFCILINLVVICFATSHVCFPRANPLLFLIFVGLIKLCQHFTPDILPTLHSHGHAGVPACPGPASVCLGERVVGFCTCILAQAEITSEMVVSFILFLLFNNQKRLFWQKQVRKEQFKERLTSSP